MADKPNFWKDADPDRLNKVRALARKAKVENMKNSGKKKGGGAFWSHELRIEAPKKVGDEIVMGPTEIIRLVPGAYEVPPHAVLESNGQYEGVLPRYVHFEYYHPTRGARGRQVPDTRDWWDQKDISRYLIDQGDEDINIRMMTYHSVVHLGRWHKTQTSTTRPGQDGQDRTYTSTEWDRCLGSAEKCEYCATGDKAVDGRPCYISCSPAIQESLDSIENTVAMFCKCGSPIPLQVNRAFCASCDHTFLEVAINHLGELERSITPEDIGNLYTQHAVCPSCKLPLVEYEIEEDSTYIAENLICMNCGNPQRANIYDADLALHKIGLGPKVRLELDQSVFTQNQRGFRIRPADNFVVQCAEMFDFFNGLKISLAGVAKRLGMKEGENPYDNAEGYKAKRTPVNKKSRYS